MRDLNQEERFKVLREMLEKTRDKGRVCLFCLQKIQNEPTFKKLPGKLVYILKIKCQCGAMYSMTTPPEFIFPNGKE